MDGTREEKLSLNRKVDIFAICALLGWAVMVFFIWAGIAHGQATSQPAPQPAVAAAGGAWVWIKGNLWWLVPLTINLLSSVATALKNYPKADGAAKVIWTIVAFLGNVEFKDGKRPGFVLKTPLTQPALPPAAAAVVAAAAAVATTAATPAAEAKADADKDKPKA